jgi:hypothetical protein
MVLSEGQHFEIVNDFEEVGVEASSLRISTQLLKYP